MPRQHKMVKCTECHASTRSDHLARHMERKHPSSPSIRSTVLPPITSSNVNDMVKYVWKTNEKVTKNHSPIFPRDIRALIVGKSGYGKTTLLMQLLLEPGMLDYDTLTVCGKSLHQPQYRTEDAAFSKGFSKSQVRTLFEQ